MSADRPGTAVQTPKVHDPIEIGGVTLANRIARSSLAGGTCGEFGSVSRERLALDVNFAKGGPGLIISSHVPILASGRVLPYYAMIDHDDRIEEWAEVVQAVEAAGSKYFLQLSHSGRQQDIGGVHNYTYADDRTGSRAGLERILPVLRRSSHIKPPSPGSIHDSSHGLRGRQMTTAEMKEMAAEFVAAARRAAKAGVHGLELHSSNGYFFTQCISSAANDRTDEYGGALKNRFRFWQEVIEGIKTDPLTRNLPLLVKLSVVEDSNALRPWRRKGNTLEESIQVAVWAEQAGADGIHVSAGDIFPHPLNPAGYLPTEVLRDTYAGIYGSGLFSKLNFRVLRMTPWALRLIWERRLRDRLYTSLGDYLRGRQPPAESADAAWRKLQGLLTDSARQIKQGTQGVAVLVTGGWQSLGAIQAGLDRGDYDMVTGARTLMANPDAPGEIVAASQAGQQDWEPARPCSMCNRCLVSAAKHPVMCLDSTRFDGDTPEARHGNMLKAGQAMYTL